VGPLTDVFALGAVLYELLVGLPPFLENDVRSTLEEAGQCHFDREALQAAGIPARLRQVCLRAMAAEPEGRHASADELADQLEAFANTSRPRAPIAALAVTLVGLVGAGWWLAGGGWHRSVPPTSPLAPDADGGTALAAQALRVTRSTPALQPPSPSFAPLRVLSLDVERYRFDPVKQRSESLGTMGWSGFAARFGDEVRVTATLSEPAHCYLVAFNPDGRWQLCYPPNSDGKPDETVRPMSQDEVRYPKRPTSYYALNDGRGQQAFVLLAAREPLPPFAEWASRLSEAPWGVERQGGVWIFQAGEIHPAHPKGDGSRGQETDRRPARFEALCNFLEERAKTEVISAIAFPVE
jgi:hypothetical protein